VAIDYFTEALKLDNGLNEARSCLANLQYQVAINQEGSDFEDAIKSFKELRLISKVESCFIRQLRADDNIRNGEILCKMADFYKEEGRFEKALETYQKSIECHSVLFDQDKMNLVYKKIDELNTDRRSDRYDKQIKSLANNPKLILPQTVAIPNDNNFQDQNS